MSDLDVIGAIALTASAAAVVGAFGASGAVAPETRARVAAILVAWFVLVAAAAATGLFSNEIGFGTPALGVAVLVPVLVGLYAASRVPSFVAAMRAIPVELLIAVQGVRVLGVFFILLHAAGRLPAPFAPIAGWGDIIAGAAALPVAWLVLKRAQGWRTTALLWNTFGLLDLGLAVGLGVTSAADSPARLFFGAVDSSAMSALPWILVPGFLVPLLVLAHLAVFWRLRDRARAAWPARA
jgi:hypothetical protein